MCRSKECESPGGGPGLVLRTLAPGATNEVLERARLLVEKAVKQNKVSLSDIMMRDERSSIPI